MEFLFNPYFQIAGVLLFIFLILLLVSVFTKKLGLNRILVLVTLLLCITGSALLGAFLPAKEVVTAYDQTSANRYIAMKYVEADLYNEAYDLMREVSASNETAEDVLALARICFLKSDYLKANLYYTKYANLAKNDTGILQEVAFANALSSCAGDDTDLSKRDELAAGMKAALTDNLDRFLKGLEDKNSIKKGAEGILAYYEYTHSFNADRISADDLKLTADILNKMVRGTGSASENSHIRDAALAINAVLGDASSIARNISEKATVNELMVATELCIGGYVTDKEFRQMPKAPDKGTISAVYQQCDRIKSNNLNKLTKEESEYYKALLGLIKNSGTNYIVKNILSMLAERTGEADNGLKSQAFMQLARGFEYAEMREQVDAYIDLALENAVSANDAVYAKSMEKVLEYVVADSSSSNNVESYISEAISRILPVDMSAFQKLPESARKDSGFMKVGFLEDLGNFVHNIKTKLDQLKATINIGRIDYSNFPQISFQVGFGANADVTFENIKNRLLISDCGYPIGDIEVADATKAKNRIILLCDNSGSMRGDVANLQLAISNFADGMQPGEEVMVIAFSDIILYNSGFLTNPAEVKEAANQMRASGGTAIYNSLQQVVSFFADDADTNNIIIVMTDGQDGGHPSDDELEMNVKQWANSYNCTIYTVGLGSVDSRYLSLIANAGDGQFLPVSNSADLDSFYSFIHSQVSNLYKVTFTAVDEGTNNRSLTVTLSDRLGKDTKEYFRLGYRDPNEEAKTKQELNVSKLDGLVVNGFGMCIYQSKDPFELSLFGENFDKNAKYEIRLVSNYNPYTLTYTYVSDTELSVTLPGGMPIGDYTLKLGAGSKVYEIKDDLTVKPAVDLQSVSYGSYTFTFEKQNEYSGNIRELYGNVIMNGWLYYDGTVTIDESYLTRTNDAYFILTTYDKAYVNYKSSNTTGFTKMIAGKGIKIPVPNFSGVTLYTNSYSAAKYSDFKVKKFTLNFPIPVRGICEVGGSMALYPDMLYSDVFYTDIKLDSLSNIIKNVPKNMFKFDATGKFMLANTGINVAADVSVDYDKNNDTSKKFQLGSIDFRVSSVKVSLDTLHEKYSVDFGVGFKAFEVGKFKVSGFGLKLGWTHDGFDEFMLSGKGDTKIKIVQTPVPMYISGLSIGAKNISVAKTKGNIFETTVVGGFKLASDDVIAKVPKKVKELFGMEELKLFTVDDAKVQITLAKFNLDFEASLKFLEMQVAKTHIAIGKMDYENDVLNINNVKEYGIDAMLAIDIEKKWKNLELDIELGGRITLGGPFSGFTAWGKIDYEISWFIFSTGKEIYGDFGFGFLWNEDSEIQFILKVYWLKSNGKPDGWRIDYSASKGKQKTNY